MVEDVEYSAAFGPELRRLRLAADISLTEFAARLFYSKGHLSRIENGRQPPTCALARSCDALLDAGGRLIALAARPGRTGGGTVPLRRRDALAIAAATLAGMGAVPPPSAAAAASDEEPAAALRELFAHLRRLGQMTDAVTVLPMLTTQTRVVGQFAARSGPGQRDELLALAARYAEYTGWMTQEAGDDAGAAQWTRHATDLAEAAGDAEFTGYALIRQSLITLYRQDQAATIGLAQAARRTAVTPHVQSQAARREAQGHALAGDYGACMRSLEQARELASRAETGLPATTLGPTHLVDPVAMITGWCLYDLGRPGPAAAQLDREFARLGPDALRSQARYGLRRALAHAGSGDIDHACRLTAQLLPTVDGIGSATVAVELRELARLLRRHGTAACVRELLPDLTESLRVSRI